MNLFDEFRELKNEQPYEAAKKLQKIQHTLLAAEDLFLAVKNLQLPASEFLQNSSVRDVTDANNILGKLLENKQ